MSYNSYRLRARTLGFNEMDIPGSSIMSKVYSYMMFALLITAGIAYPVSNNPGVLAWFQANQWALILLFIAELGLVLFISGGLDSMSFPALMLAYIAYSAANGVTIGIVLTLYTKASVFKTFVVCAGMFGGTSIYGAVTKRNLDSWFDFLFMGLIGLLIMMVVNIIFHSTMMDWLITAFGIIVFVGLTAYDTQKIKELSYGSWTQEGGQKFALIGALNLYLDFINLFLFLLRIFGVSSSSKD